jgi:MFS transporter, UMF1 family
VSEGVVERAQRRVVQAWCLYDWASSAFVTTVVVALFPPFFRRMAQDAGLAPATATAAWGYVTAIGLLLAAFFSPLLGAYADRRGIWKRPLAISAGLGILATAACAGIPNRAWLLAGVLFLVADLGFAGANVLYESLLPRIARPSELNRVSTRGYALGYVGGGCLLLVNLLWVTRPHAFGMPDAGFAVRAAFVSVALWWAVFALPLLRTVPEGPGTTGDSGPPARDRTSFFDAWRQLRRTAREIGRYRQLLLFLAAFWLYNDGIGTIIKMATAYGDEIGIGISDMLIALVITQFVGIPCALLFGRLAQRIGTRRAILSGLAVYVLIAIGGYFLRTATHFYLLALLVGMVQGGTQALSRSLFARLVPRDRTAEFFGFFSTSARLAGLAGPLLFGVVTQWSGEGRLGIVAIVIFFVAGAFLLTRVKLEEDGAPDAPEAAAEV